MHFCHFSPLFWSVPLVWVHIPITQGLNRLTSVGNLYVLHFSNYIAIILSRMGKNLFLRLEIFYMLPALPGKFATT